MNRLGAYLMGLSLILGGGGLGWAADYRTQVLAADQEAPARLEALRTAVQQFALQLTGAPEAVTASRLGSVWRDPTRYVQEYRYTLAPQVPPESPQRLLDVRFDATALEQGLANAGVPTWRKRPPVLLWLVEWQAGRQVLLGEQDPRLRPLLAEAQQALGYEILLPLGDLEDQRNLPMSDLWGGFTEVIRPASARYGAPLILVGRLAPQPEGGWQGRWLLLGPEERLVSWETPAGDAAAALSSGLGESWNRLWRNFGPAAPGLTEQVQTLEITGIDQPGAYAALLASLRTTAEVRAVQLERYAADTLTLKLRYQGTPEALRQAVAQQGRLVPETLEARASVWRYRWR